MRHKNAFTLIELMVTVAVIAVGMVFVLGAFSRSMAALVTAQRMVQAQGLLNAQIWVLDLDGRQANPVIPVQANGTFPEPNERFNWTRETQSLGVDFGSFNQTKALGELFVEETVSVGWIQSRVPKNLTITRFVRKRYEPPGS